MGLGRVRAGLRLGEVHACYHQGHAATRERRQVWIRVPHDRAEARLRLHRPGTAVKAPLIALVTQEAAMSTTAVAANQAATGSNVGQVDLKLEVVTIPVSDVNR